LGEVDLTDYILRVPGMDPKSIKQDMFEMNLDVNFVNNRRMRINDYKTAIASFEEVISRHEEQPFAHYYLAKSIEKSSGNNETILKHMNRYKEIISKDNEWAITCKKFGLKT
jgi:hypothetical protein